MLSWNCRILGIVNEDSSFCLWSRQEFRRKLFCVMKKEPVPLAKAAFLLFLLLKSGYRLHSLEKPPSVMAVLPVQPTILMYK